jgi:hypothetical protein
MDETGSRVIPTPMLSSVGEHFSAAIGRRTDAHDDSVTEKKEKDFTAG